MESHPRCRILEWDSDFFDRRIARVQSPKLTRREASTVLAWARRESVDCVYLLVNSEDPETTDAAERAGFRLTDVRVTLSRVRESDDLVAGPESLAIELAKPNDVPALRAIARISHRHTRFHADPNFPSEQCDALYAKWIEKSCADYADAVLVARQGGSPIAYLTCHLDSDSTGSIGLFAVSTDVRGRAFGRRLLRASLEWFARAEAALVVVATQGRNANAVRLYEKAGFTTQSVQLWYHLWPARLEAGTEQ